MGRIKRKVVNDVLVEDFAAEGKCFARIEGEITFLNGAVVCPGDRVDVEIKRRKKGWQEAYVLSHKSFSPDRIAPQCEHFGVCGGCKWQHIPYEMQINQKQKQVIDQLTRIGKLTFPEIMPIKGSEKQFFYRNKLEYTFSNARWLTREEINADGDYDRDALGFHIPGKYDKILPVNKCFLQPDPSNAIRDFLDSYAKEHKLSYYDHVKHEGFLRSVMIRTSSIGETMVVIQFADQNDFIEATLKALSDKFPEITSLFYFLNKKRNDSFADLEPIYFSGKRYITEVMEDLKFRIGPKSFYQTNSLQAYELYKITRELAAIQPSDIVYDLYTGTGTIANFIARNAKKVIGIEYIDEAIEDAHENAKENGIDNVEFFAGDMKNILTEEFVTKNGKPDVIITDPPRAGMDKPVIDVILNAAPDRIVYVSCNPATQARDLQLMSEYYQIEAVQPVDMFPHTHHVENVIKLKRIN